MYLDNPRRGNGGQEQSLTAKKHNRELAMVFGVEGSEPSSGGYDHIIEKNRGLTGSWNGGHDFHSTCLTAPSPPPVRVT